MLRKLWLTLVFLTLQCPANMKEDNKTMQSILMNKPYYTLNIETDNSDVFITMNGELVFKQFDRGPHRIEVPVSQWMINGKNTLDIKLLASKHDNLTMHPKTEAKVTLLLKEGGVYDKPSQIVSQVIYKDKSIENSSEEGKYASFDDFKPHNEGDIEISKTEVKFLSVNRTGSTYKIVELTQSITLETPFPRWKFMDSDNIIDGNYYDLDRAAYNKLRKRKDIEEIYQIHLDLYNALQRKDLKSVIPLFSERNSEMEIAMYKEKGYYENAIYDSLKRNVNDPEMEMLEFLPHKRFFYISEGGKTLYIRRAVVFNRKDGQGRESYDLLFRKEKGKWILTR